MAGMRIERSEVVKERWRAYKARVKRSQQRHESRVKGLDLVLRLDDGRKLEFRGRGFHVRPVPWPLAIRVAKAQEAFDDFLTQSRKHRQSPDKVPAPSIEQWATVYKETARLFKKLCRPEGLIRRLLWPITPSPINGAPPTEVGMALGFFSECLRLDAVETLIRETARPSTSPTSSDASVSASPRGATNAASRARGRRS